MLPSFRLIVATFMCGFAVVFAGLRIAGSLNGALPVTAAHAGAHVLTANGEAHVASMPAMFDARFAITPAPAVLVRATPSVLERPSLPLSVTPPLSVAPPQDAAAAEAVTLAPATEPAQQPGKPEDVLATVQPASPAAPADAEPTAAADAPPPTDPQQ
jgi:hypothetical protein